MRFASFDVWMRNLNIERQELTQSPMHNENRQEAEYDGENYNKGSG